MRNKVAEISREKGIPTYYALQRETGLPMSTCQRIWTDPNNVRFHSKTLRVLCDALECSPKELIAMEMEANAE